MFRSGLLLSASPLRDLSPVLLLLAFALVVGGSVAFVSFQLLLRILDSDRGRRLLPWVMLGVVGYGLLWFSSLMHE
jgi:NO-binding membrane sensor protein with MHYT domain